MPRESESKKIERIMENIVFCHFEDRRFNDVRRELRKVFGWSGTIAMHTGAKKLLKHSEAARGHKYPDKYLEEAGTGCKVLVDFKVSRRHDKAKLADQMAGYREGFELPIFILSAWKWEPADLATHLRAEGLEIERDIFFFNYSFQAIIDLAKKPAVRGGITHAQFRKVDDAYVLVKRGSNETDTLGFIWSAVHRDLCLPIRCHRDGEDPLKVGVFPWGENKNRDFLSIIEGGGAALKTLNGTFAGEVAKAGIGPSGEWELLWPPEGLLDLWERIKGDLQEE